MFHKKVIQVWVNYDIIQIVWVNYPFKVFYPFFLNEIIL